MRHFIRFPALYAALATAAPCLAQGVTNLNSYFSAANGDNLCSTSSSYIFTPPPGYVFYRIEGQTLNAVSPGQLNMLPLHRWYNPVRGDYFTTSNPIWYGSNGATQDGYTWNGREGYVFSSPLAGTGDLRLYFSSSREDNFTTADPYYTYYLPPSGYFNVASQGYIIHHPAGEISRESAFEFGTLHGGGPATGAHKLVVCIVEYSDQRSRHSNAQIASLIHGPAFPNVAGYFSNTSLNTFSWQNAGVLGPFTMANEADTSGNESLYSDVWNNPAAPFLFVALTAGNGANSIGCSGGAGSVAFANGGAGGGINLYETFVLADLNGGSLLSGEQVGFKTFNKTFLRVSGTSVFGDAVSTAGNDARFIVTKVGGSAGATIINGDVMNLRSVQTNNLLRAPGGGGGALLADTTTASFETSFNMYKAGVAVGIQLRECLRQAVAGGFNLAALDTNHDGTVSNDECQFAVIGAGPLTMARGGGTRDGSVYTVPGSGVMVAPQLVSGMGEDTSLMTVCHELSHALDKSVRYELYGGQGAMNYYLALMGATIFPVDDDRTSFMHDPWTRMRYGWLHPRIFNLNDAGGAVTLTAADGGIDTIDKRPLLLYDRLHFNPDTGAGEFFMVEFRSWASGGSGYDHNIPDTGLAVWLCHTVAGGIPADIPSVLGACCTSSGCIVDYDHNCTGAGMTFKGCGTACAAGGGCPSGTPPIVQYDGAINILGAPGVFRGESRLWTYVTQPPGGIVPVYSSGTPASVHIRVAPFTSSARSCAVEWSFSGDLPARIDSITPTRFRRGRLLTFTGMFGTREPFVDTRNTANTYLTGDLSIRNYTSSGFMAHYPTSTTNILGTVNISLYNTFSGFRSNTFQVAVLPASDWNEDGSISVQDIFDFLADYFSGGGDFNNVNFTTVQDIFDFLAAYFAGL